MISKVLEKVVAEQLMNYLECNTICHPKLFGFRPKYLTEMATCYLMENIKSFLGDDKVVDAVFIDLKKTFDTVNHEILLNKHQMLNFSQQVINWFRSYL